MKKQIRINLNKRSYPCTTLLDYLNGILIIFHASLIIMKVKHFIDNNLCLYLIFWFLKFTFNTFYFYLNLILFLTFGNESVKIIRKIQCRFCFTFFTKHITLRFPKNSCFESLNKRIERMLMLALNYIKFFY